MEKGKVIVFCLGDMKEEWLVLIEDFMEKVMWEVVEIMYGDGEFDERNKKIMEYLVVLYK